MRDKQRQPAEPVGVPPSHQLRVLPFPLGIQDLLDLGVGPGLLLQLRDARGLDRRDVARIEVLGHEPGRGRQGDGRRGDAQPRSRRGRSSAIAHGRTSRASCTSALGPPRRSISNGHDVVAARAGDAGRPVGPEVLDGAERAGVRAQTAVGFPVRRDLHVLPGHTREQGQDAAVGAQPAAVRTADEHAGEDEAAADGEHVERPRHPEQGDEGIPLADDEAAARR